MADLEVDLASGLGRKLVRWAMDAGAGARDLELKALVARIRRKMRRCGLTRPGAEEYTILSYETPEDDGHTHKYVIRVDSD